MTSVNDIIVKGQRTIDTVHEISRATPSCIGGVKCAAINCGGSEASNLHVVQTASNGSRTNSEQTNRALRICAIRNKRDGMHAQNEVATRCSCECSAILFLPGA